MNVDYENSEFLLFHISNFASDPRAVDLLWTSKSKIKLSRKINLGHVWHTLKTAFQEKNLVSTVKDAVRNILDWHCLRDLVACSQLQILHIFKEYLKITLGYWSKRCKWTTCGSWVYQQNSPRNCFMIKKKKKMMVM